MAGKFRDWSPEGVIPAALLPFDDELEIDAPSYRSHLADLASVRGISAVTVNAHASEVHACSFEEQQAVLGHSMDAIGDRLPIVHGVYADGSRLAARIARMAEAGGAAALLVFPPQSMTMGGQLRPEMALAHFKAIAAASDLPIIVFQYPLAGGLGYPFDTLLRLCEEIPRIKAIKDWCNDPMLHERQVRTFQALPRKVNILTTHSAWLLGSLLTGCKGLLSGAGSVIADLHLALFEAVRVNDLVRARAISDRIYPLTQAFYAPPFLDMHNRMKETLVLLGRLKRAVVRPPLVKLGAAEIERLKAAITAARLGREGALPAAAE